MSHVHKYQNDSWKVFFKKQEMKLKEFLKTLAKIYLALLHVAVTKYHRLGSYSNRNLFRIPLESGSLRPGCQPGQMKASFWVSDFSLYFYLAGGIRELFRVFFFHKGTNLFHEVFTLMT